MKIALISSNEERYLEALVEEGFDIRIVISNNEDAEVIKKAGELDIDSCVIGNELFGDRKEHDRAIMEELDKTGVDLVILGGYRRLIKNKEFLNKYGKKMMNIHNSFLPNFPGAWPHEVVFKAGLKKSGYSIHFVDEVMDRGEIIFQEEVDICYCLSPQEVYDKLVLAGCSGLKEVVGEFVNRKIKVRSCNNFGD